MRSVWRCPSPRAYTGWRRTWSTPPARSARKVRVRALLGGRDDHDAVAAGVEQCAAILADRHYRKDARRETRVARIRIGLRAVRRERHRRRKRNVAELLEITVVDETAAQNHASSASVQCRPGPERFQRQIHVRKQAVRGSVLVDVLCRTHLALDEYDP